MGKIVRNLFGTAFDPETVKCLCDAYDRACTSLHDRGQPDIVNEVIAERISPWPRKESATLTNYVLHCRQ